MGWDGATHHRNGDKANVSGTEKLEALGKYEQTVFYLNADKVFSGVRMKYGFCWVTSKKKNGGADHLVKGPQRHPTHTMDSSACFLIFHVIFAALRAAVKVDLSIQMTLRMDGKVLGILPMFFTKNALLAAYIHFCP